MPELTEWQKEAPHIWIGCLACYNEGRLTGDWYMAVDGDKITWQDLHAGKKISMLYPHEEIWVMDHEYFHGLLTGECSPYEAAKIAQAMDEYSGQVPLEVACQYAHDIDPGGTTDTIPERLAQADEAFAGIGTLADVVEEFYESTTDPQQREAMGDLWNYINWESIARNWDSEGYHSHKHGADEYWFRPV